QRAGVDRVFVAIGIGRALSLDSLLQRRVHPLAVRKERRKTCIIALLEESLGLADSSRQNLLPRCVRLKWLVLLDADGAELIDHRAVAIDPRLALHDAVEVHEIACVVTDGAVVIDVLYIRENRLGRIGPRR